MNDIKTSTCLYKSDSENGMTSTAPFMHVCFCGCSAVEHHYVLFILVDYLFDSF